jgi:hypothetical protein
MPIAKLIYRLPEEKEEYELAFNGAKYKYAIDELDNWLRNILKYNDGNIEKAKIKVLQEVRNKLWEIINDSDVKF